MGAPPREPTRRHSLAGGSAAWAASCLPTRRLLWLGPAHGRSAGTLGRQRTGRKVGEAGRGTGREGAAAAPQPEAWRRAAGGSAGRGGACSDPPTKRDGGAGPGTAQRRARRRGAAEGRLSATYRGGKEPGSQDPGPNRGDAPN